MKKLFLLLFACLSTLVFSQNNQNINVVVYGQVTDSLTSETIPFATMRITIAENQANVIKVAAADDNGKFQFTMDKTGDYLLTVQFIGKKTLLKPFTITLEKKLDLGKLQMSDDSEMLNEVVVMAQKPLIKIDMDKITYSMEDDPESKTNNVLDMLKKVPMITVDGEDNIQLKGSSSFKIYMNGKPSNMITSNPKDVLKSMPANTIKDIEVITDPGVKYDAEGVAGIINIITFKHSEMGGYTATVNSRVDSRGSYGLGGFLSMKLGKFGFSGNYNYYNYTSPRASSSTFRDNKMSDEYKYLTQSGTSEWNGDGQYGSGEFSYEVDTLNLISLAFNRYQGKGKSDTDYIVDTQNSSRQSVQKYGRDSRGEYTYGSTEFNIDYQRTFSVKERLLTASYRFGMSPDDFDSETSVNNILNYRNSRDKQFSDAEMKEHTFQLDFTTPIAKIHKLEAGIKYIIRLNESYSGYDTLNTSNNEWIHKPITINDEFKHRQDIFAAYAGYNVKWRKFGFKTGLRYEFTDLEAKFPIDNTNNFSTDYSNIIPSATITYQINQSQNMRLGYNMRISRPAIWQLNPYRNTTDSSYITMGNPELDAVKSHSISLNYGLFNPKLNVNLNMSYSFENNAIEDITEIVNNVSMSKPQNIGKNKSFYLGGYLNWTLNTKIRINSNLSTRYVDIRANNESNLKNHGFTSNVMGGVQYTLPKSFKINVYGGYYSPWIQIQGKGSAFHYHSLSLSKGFLNDRLNFNLSTINPLKNDMTHKQTQETAMYYYESENISKRRSVSFSVSFRFGEMKSQIKKAQRGITNDDVMNSGSSGQQGGGQGGGQ